MSLVFESTGWQEARESRREAGGSPGAARPTRGEGGGDRSTTGRQEERDETV